MIFDHKLWLFGVSFHIWTFIVLLGTLVVDFLVKRRQGMPGHIALVHGTALTTFTIHFYEIAHSGAEKYFTGFQSPSMWVVNFPFALVALSVLFYLETPQVSLSSLCCLVLTGLLFQKMGVTGFFSSGFPKNVWWAGSKAVTSLLTVSLFTFNGGKSVE